MTTLYDKSRVAEAIRHFGAEFSKRYRSDRVWTDRFRSGDDSTTDEIVEAACRSAGIDPESYRHGIELDPELHALQTTLITDAVLRDINPGPSNPKALESLGARIAPKITGEKPWWKFWQR